MFQDNARTLWIMLGIGTGVFWSWAVSMIFCVPWWLGAVSFLAIMTLMVHLSAQASKKKKPQ
jgi:hypothetical protein